MTRFIESNLLRKAFQSIACWIVWENGIKLVILCQDSHIALDEDEPDKPTDGISPEEKAYGREVIVYAS